MGGTLFLGRWSKRQYLAGEVLFAPAESVDEIYPKLEAPGIDENAAEATNRTLQTAAANRRIDDYNEERRRKGPRIGHNWYFLEAEARLKSRLFFSLGNEGNKRFLNSPSGPKYMLLHRLSQVLRRPP